MTNKENFENKIDVDLPVNVEEQNKQVEEGVTKKGKCIKVNYDNEWLISRFCEYYEFRLFGRRKINIDKNTVHEYCQKLKEYLIYFNSGDEFTYFMLDVPVDTIPIKNQFKDLILPKSIRLNPSDRKTKNLTKYCNPLGLHNLSLLGWINLLDNIARITKESGSDDCTTIGSLRSDKSFNECIDRLIYKGKVRYDGTAFMPLYMDESAAAMMESDYFDTKADTIVQHYVANLK